MAFIRKKTINGKTYHYLVESRRVDGKPRQRVIAYLGEWDTVEDAYVMSTGTTRRVLKRYRDPKDVQAELQDEARVAANVARHKARSNPLFRHYTTLGLTPGVSPVEIKSRYRELARQFHPDRNQAGAERMAAINVAYEALQGLT